MSNKLLTGAIAVSLLLMSSAATYADVPVNGKLHLDPTVNTNAPGYGQSGDELLRHPASPVLNRPRAELLGSTNAFIELDGGTFLPVFECTRKTQWLYLSGLATIDLWHFGDYEPAPYTIFGMRVPVEEGFLCSLNRQRIHIADIVGNMDLEFAVWTNSGGLPGVKLASQIVSTATLTTGFQWGADWSGMGLLFTEDFFLTFGTVLNSGTNPGDGPLNDHITVFVTNVDESAPPTIPSNLAATFYPAPAGPDAWRNSTDAWGVDLHYITYGETCCEEIPFTNCAFDLLSTGVFVPEEHYFNIFSLPHSGNCRQGLSMRFQSGGYDTLVTARLGFTDHPALGAGFEPGAAMLIEILGDDGAGTPDPTNVLFSTVVGGAGNENDLIPFGNFAFEFLDVPLGGLIIPPMTSYHLATRWVGPIPQNLTAGTYSWMFLGGNAVNGTSDRGGLFFAGTYGTHDATCEGNDDGAGNPVRDGWYNYFATFGVPFELWLDVEVCVDEFNICEVATNYNVITFNTCWVDIEGLNASAGVFAAGGSECRIEQAGVWMDDYIGLLGITLSIRADDAGGDPGTVLYSEFIDQTTWPVAPNPLLDGSCDAAQRATPNFFLEIFPNGGAGVTVGGSYFIVVEYAYDYSLGNAGQASQWLRHDDFRIAGATCQTLVGFDTTAAGGTGLVDVWTGCLFGLPLNQPFENFRCCIPFDERVCIPGEDWPTYHHDYARTGASFNALGLANCNLNQIWSASSDAPNALSGSVIFGDKVIISDDGGYDCRDLATGALIWDQVDVDASGGPGNMFLPLGQPISSNRTQPTVAEVDVAGVPTLMAFLGDGSGRDMIAVEANTGQYLYHVTTGSPGLSGIHPETQNVKSVIVGGVLFYAAKNKLYAVNAADGSAAAGWAANPVITAGDNLNAISTDGDRLYVPTVNAGLNAGNVTAYDPTDGTIVWDLQTVTGFAGLEPENQAIEDYDGREAFFSGAALDIVQPNPQGVLWVGSSYNAKYPNEGFLYRVALDGSGYSATFSARTLRSTPIIDANQIYLATNSGEPIPGVYAGVGVYARSSGGFLESLEGIDNFVKHGADGVLSCEAGVDDWLVIGNNAGTLNFFTVGEVNQLQFTRVNSLSGGGGGEWHAGSLSPGALVFTTLAGKTIAFASGADRARLTLPSPPEIVVPVPFGSAVGHVATFEGAISNLGCIDLIIDSIRLDDVSVFPGSKSELTTVSPQLTRRMGEVANYQTGSALFAKFGMMYANADLGVETDPVTSYLEQISTSSDLNYRAALAFPDVIVQADGDQGVLSPAPGDAVSPGATIDIVLSVDGPKVLRGPHEFFATIYSNDPDYYLDDPSIAPELLLNVVGGCLQDSVTLTFGVGAANFAHVFNTTLEQSFNSEGHQAILIEGFGGADFFAGFRYYSQLPQRLAASGRFNVTWNAILGDPNYCSNVCRPELLSGVLLGTMSFDNGVNYDDVFGDLAATTYIDSMRDYRDAGVADGWNWDKFPIPAFLPDSTIGFITNETHYGVLDVQDLAAIRLIRYDVTNRNATDPIDDLVMGSFHDDDIDGGGGGHKLVGNTAYGYAYAYQPGGTSVHGYISLPFGCGIETGSTIRGRAANGGAWGFSETMFDSIYTWLHNPGFAGLSCQDQMCLGDPGQSDFESSYGFGRMDIPGGGTVTKGIAQFAYAAVPGGDNSDADQFIGLADLTNKFAGFGRGDVNNDLSIDLADILYCANIVAGGRGAYPFAHLSDVNNDGVTDLADVDHLVAYYFGCGACPVGDWVLALCATNG